MYPFRTSSYGEIGQVYPFCSYNTILNAYFDTYGIEVFYYLKIKELQTLFPFVELKKMHISSIIIKEKLLFTEVNMEIIKISTKDADRIAHLVSAFRIQLKSYKGIKSKPNVEAGKEEILEFLQSGFPVYAVEDNGTFVGYIVCRIEKPCLWVEHIYVPRPTPPFAQHRADRTHQRGCLTKIREAALIAKEYKTRLCAEKTVQEPGFGVKLKCEKQ